MRVLTCVLFCLGRGMDLEEIECGFDGCQTQGFENRACLPVPIPYNDTEFYGEPCLMFVRSLEVPNLECTFGKCISSEVCTNMH